VVFGFGRHSELVLPPRLRFALSLSEQTAQPRKAKQHTRVSPTPGQMNTVTCLKRCSDGKYVKLPQDIPSFLVVGRGHTADHDGRVSTNHATIQRDVDSAHAKKRYSWGTRLVDTWELRFTSVSKDSPAGSHQKTDKAKATPSIKFYSMGLKLGGAFSLLPDNSHRFVLVCVTASELAANEITLTTAEPAAGPAAPTPIPKGRARTTLQRVSTLPFEDPDKVAFDQTGGGGKQTGKRAKKSVRHSKSTKQHFFPLTVGMLTYTAQCDDEDMHNIPGRWRLTCVLCFSSHRCVASEPAHGDGLPGRFDGHDGLRPPGGRPLRPWAQQPLRQGQGRQREVGVVVGSFETLPSVCDRRKGSGADCYCFACCRCAPTATTAPAALDAAAAAPPPPAAAAAAAPAAPTAAAAPTA
jgi:hypothetical protein